MVVHLHRGRISTPPRTSQTSVVSKACFINCVAVAKGNTSLMFAEVGAFRCLARSTLYLNLCSIEDD